MAAKEKQMVQKEKQKVEIPENKRDLLSREKKAFANIAYILSDGSPSVTPIWFDWDGEHIIINTARGRVKSRVLSKRSQVALDIVDPDNPYRYLLIRGRVTAETEQGAADQIKRLNQKYQGKYDFTLQPDEVRVTYLITPEHVS